jgi:predicted porin
VIKVAIRLAIVAMLANGTWRVGSAYAQHYRSKDAVTQTTQYRGNRSDDQIRARIFELAATYDIPLTEGNLTITQRENHTIVDCEYKRPIEVFPGFIYEWPFTVHVDTFVIEPPRFP